MRTMRRTVAFGDRIPQGPETPYGFHPGTIFNEAPLDDALPIEGYLAGMHLKQLTPKFEKDPVVLYDRWGAILHQWPDEYMPTLVDIRSVIVGLHG